MREQNHISYRRRVGQQHCQPIHADAFTGCRRHAIAQRPDVVVVHQVRFFVEVLVNCPEEDLRRNRLALLASIQKEFSRVADFSEIVVEKEK